MVLFEKPGKQNAQAAIGVACAKAKELDARLVVASTGGETALLALRELRRLGVEGGLVVVGSVFDYKATPEGGNKMDQQTRRELEAAGVPIVFATHVLSGVERSLSNKFTGVYPAEIIAHTLRMFGQGVKVCVECAVMALDAGLLPYGKPVVCLGGTGRGADTACLITPAHSNDVLSTKVHEIYCKPSLL